jgi:hypothetical protein
LYAIAQPGARPYRNALSCQPITPHTSSVAILAVADKTGRASGWHISGIPRLATIIWALWDKQTCVLMLTSMCGRRATARVVDKTVSHSGNTGNRSGRDEHFLVCEIRPDPGSKTYRGEVQINFVSWSLTKVGQEIEVRYERTNPTIMRLPRSIGNWPFGLFSLAVGVFGFLVVVRSLLWPRPANVGRETPGMP